MLSDAINETRRCLDEYRGGPVELAPEAVEALLLTYRAWEIEARNMEERLEGVAALRPHAAILPAGGNVIAFPARAS